MGLSEELSERLVEVKREVMRRFKHLKYEELNEELRKVDRRRDKMKYNHLNTELKSLQYNPSSDGVNIVSLEEIESKVKSLIADLRRREEDLMNEDGESSMLCDLSVLNLMSFLKHFGVEMSVGEDCDKDKENSKEDSKNKDLLEELERKHNEINIWAGKFHKLTIKWEEKEKEVEELRSKLTSVQRKQGIGLKEPHVRISEPISVLFSNSTSNGNGNGMRVVTGTFRDLNNVSSFLLLID